MKRELMKMIRCPTCRGKLIAEVTFEDAEIKEGELKCESCSSLYKIIDGIAVLLKHEDLDDLKKKEINGWRARRTQHADSPEDVEKSPENGEDTSAKCNENKFLTDELEYSPDYADAKEVAKERQVESPYTYLLSLPYIDQNSLHNGIDKSEITYWEKVSSCFDICLEKLNLNPKLNILEVGAGSGWACRRFSELGCDAVALDISFDNLSDGNHLVELTDSYFERVIGDAEDVPFEDEIFDVVFMCATLHHSTNLRLMVGELNRVLKDGGVIFVINEPVRPITKNEDDLLANNDEKELGINEHIFSYFQYKKAFLQNMMTSHVYLEEFESKNSFRNMIDWLKSENAIKYRICGWIIQRRLMKPVLQLFWMLFLGGNLNIYAKKH